MRTQVLGIGPLPVPTLVLAIILAVVIVVCALAVAFSRRAVHAAVYMVGVMLSLSVIYFLLGAEFLGAVQVVVYTGAIMMLFLFVIMLIGVQSTDSPQESRASLVLVAVLLGLAVAVISGIAVARSTLAAPGQSSPNVSNPQAIASSVINQHFFAMELVATLLIIAAVGAMVLTYSDRLLPKVTQRFVVQQRMNAYRDQGVHVGQQSPPGVYATTNAVDVPAISGETGEAMLETVARVVRVNGETRSIGMAAPWAARRLADQKEGKLGLHGAQATRSVQQSGEWGMPGTRLAVLAVEDITAASSVGAVEPGESVGSVEEEGEN